jgi:hypothetical protein
MHRVFIVGHVVSSLRGLKFTGSQVYGVSSLRGLKFTGLIDPGPHVSGPKPYSRQWPCLLLGGVYMAVIYNTV